MTKTFYALLKYEERKRKLSLIIQGKLKYNSPTMLSCSNVLEMTIGFDPHGMLDFKQISSQVTREGQHGLKSPVRGEERTPYLRACACSAENPDCVSQDPHRGSRLLAATAPGDALPSSGLCGLCTHSVLTHRPNTHAKLNLVYCSPLKVDLTMPVNRRTLKSSPTHT